MVFSTNNRNSKEATVEATMAMERPDDWRVSIGMGLMVATVVMVLLGWAGAAEAAETAAAASASSAAPAVASTVAATAAVGAQPHGHSSRHHRGHYRSYPRYYGSFHFGFPYFSLGYYDHGPYYHGTYGHRGYYRSYGSEPLGGIDFNVRPKKGEVFVDGQPIGTVKQYDGFPSYLWLEQGTYDVAVYLDGYQTLSRQISIYPGIVIDFDDRMEAGEAKRPEDLVSKSTQNRDERMRRNVERKRTAERQHETHQRETRQRAADEPGRLVVSVWPDDAVLYLDGQFLGAADELMHVRSGLVVEPGWHTLEVVRPGYESDRREIEITAGERYELSLELDDAE